MNEENGLMKMPVDVFTLMDREDDKQIIAEIENRVVKKWCYEITDKKTGKVTIGPSKAGIDACVQLLAKKGEILRDEDLRWQELPNGEMGFVAIVAKYMVSPDGKEVKLDQAIGTKNQPLHFDKEKTNENPHWFTTGSQKAVRNARRRLIPEAIVTEMIRMAKEQSEERVKRLEHDASNTVDAEVVGGADPGETILDFGKQHSGKKLKDIPDDYLDWVANKAKDPQMRKDAAETLKRKRRGDYNKPTGVPEPAKEPAPAPSPVPAAGPQEGKPALNDPRFDTVKEIEALLKELSPLAPGDALRDYCGYELVDDIPDDQLKSVKVRLTMARDKKKSEKGKK